MLIAAPSFGVTLVVALAFPHQLGSASFRFCMFDCTYELCAWYPHEGFDNSTMTVPRLMRTGGSAGRKSLSSLRLFSTGVALSFFLLTSVGIVIKSMFLAGSTSSRELRTELDNPPPSTIHDRHIVEEDGAQMIHICFVSAQFAPSAELTDRLMNVTKVVPEFARSPYFHFFAFTNLPDLKAPGWDIIVKDLPEYKRFITQSRWPKFQGFKESRIQETCQVVFYMDGILSPTSNTTSFQSEARQILNSTVQFSQRLHSIGGGAEAEFRRIRRKKKDIVSNIRASIKWLKGQSDYRRNCTLYENNMFAYSLNSTEFQTAANFFWDHYSQEKDSWRGELISRSEGPLDLSPD